MGYDEYKPHGGWISFRKRKAIKEKIKSTLMAIVAIVVYAAASTLTASI